MELAARVGLQRLQAAVRPSQRYFAPLTYEAIDPADFGLTRRVDVGSRVTGRHAVAHRASSLGFQLGSDEVGRLTAAIKERAEHGALSQEAVDAFISEWCMRTGVYHGNADAGNLWA